MKKIRELMTGDAVPSLDHPEKITIHTHCPDKWRFLDLETGQSWMWNRTTKQFEEDSQTTMVAFEGDEEN
jgi:hypothetical protein